MEITENIPKNKGKRWKEDDINKLKDYLKNGLTIEELKNNYEIEYLIKHIVNEEKYNIEKTNYYHDNENGVEKIDKSDPIKNNNDIYKIDENIITMNEKFNKHMNFIEKERNKLIIQHENAMCSSVIKIMLK